MWRLRRFPSFVWGGIQRKLTSAWLVVDEHAQVKQVVIHDGE